MLYRHSPGSMKMPIFLDVVLQAFGLKEEEKLWDILEGNNAYKLTSSCCVLHEVHSILIQWSNDANTIHSWKSNF